MNEWSRLSPSLFLTLSGVPGPRDRKAEKPRIESNMILKKISQCNDVLQYSATTTITTLIFSQEPPSRCQDP